jgi:ELWxxDGT repeat protein
VTPTANDGVAWREVRRTDGFEATQVANIYPGGGLSYPSGYYEFAGQMMGRREWSCGGWTELRLLLLPTLNLAAWVPIHRALLPTTILYFGAIRGVALERVRFGARTKFFQLNEWLLKKALEYQCHCIPSMHFCRSLLSKETISLSARNKAVCIKSVSEHFRSLVYCFSTLVLHVV